MAYSVDVLQATIADAATTSNAVDLRWHRLYAVYVPATFEGTTLAVHASDGLDGTYFPLYDDAGTAVSLTVAASRVVGIDSAAGAMAAVRYIKLVAGTAQTGPTTLVLLAK